MEKANSRVYDLVSTLEKYQSTLTVLSDKETRIVAAALGAFSANRICTINAEELSAIEKKLGSTTSQLNYSSKKSPIKDFFDSVGGFFKVVFFIRRSESHLKSCISSACKRKVELEASAKDLKSAFNEKKKELEPLKKRKEFWTQLFSKILKMSEKSKKEFQLDPSGLKNEYKDLGLESEIESFNEAKDKRDFAHEKCLESVPREVQLENEINAVKLKIEALNEQLELHGMSDLKINLDAEKNK